ncbi:MAG: Kelch repeat-containing protein [Candidatus Limnocylindria bacterium]
MGRLLALGTLAVMVAACGAATPASSEAVTTAPAGESLAPAPPSANVPRELAWEILEPAPFERIEMATVAHGGEIWLIGGLDLDGASDETWRFDPIASTWEEGPLVDRAIHHAAAVSTGEDLYVIGGYEGIAFDTPRTSVLVLNDTQDGWDEGVALPQPRAAGGAAWDGSRIVYAGGVGLGIVSDVMALVDGEWVRIGAMRAPREHLSATSDGEGRVWLLGGRQGTLDTNSRAVDLVEGNAVTRIGELPTARGGAGAFYLPEAGACLAGGEQPDRALDAVECVGADGSLTTLPPLAVPVHGHGAAVVEGVAYMILGGPEPLLTVSGTIQRLGPGP